MLIGALVFIYLQNCSTKTPQQKSQISEHTYLCMHTKLYLVSTVWEMWETFLLWVWRTRNKVPISTECQTSSKEI